MASIKNIQSSDNNTVDFPASEANQIIINENDIKDLNKLFGVIHMYITGMSYDESHTKQMMLKSIIKLHKILGDHCSADINRTINLFQS